MVRKQFPLYIYSRQYHKNLSILRSLIPSGVEISGLSSAAAADLVIVAVPKDFYPSIPANLLKGKVVVDVSNRATIRRDCTE